MNYASRMGPKSFAFIVIACITACADTTDDLDGQPATGMVVVENVEVPMRDGVVLRADVYRPGGDGSFPVLVYRTPYGKHETVRYYETHLRAVERGYAVVLQDVRGRYASDGIFEPYRQEGTDGYDTIEWTARQPWSNGSIGTFGLSYPGAVQWLAALESPPALKAMAPAMTFSSPRKFFYTNGIFDLSWLPWIYLYVAPDARVRLGLPGITDEESARASWETVADDYVNYLPLIELPYLKDAAPFYYEWLEHPPEDAWWDWAEIRGRYQDVDAAVLHLSGWHDEVYGPEGAITNHTGIAASRDDPARSHLIVGPWKHGVLETGQRQVGDLDFGPAAGIDYDEVLLRFFDEYLRGRDTGLAAEPPVRYFVTGENEWHNAARWPPPEAEPQAMCLANGSLRSCEATAGAPASSFTADPADPVTDPYDDFGPHDYRELAGRPDVLTFDSAPLPEDLSVAGNAMATVFVSCDCRDFDLWFRLYDVYPDGRSINLRSPGAAAMRASYRERPAGRRLLEPGEIYELRLDPVMLANTFKAGHRIRVQVSASFTPHLSRNPQTGESEIFSSETQRARITIHHDTEHPSGVSLPVLKSGADFSGTPRNAALPHRGVRRSARALTGG